MKKVSIVLLSTSLLLMFACGELQSSKKDYKDSSLSISERVDALLPLMSLEEKVAQMRIFHANMGAKPDQEGNLDLSKEVVEKL